jgi:hypothetical protein
MHFMLRTLRTLLISAAALATVLVGLRESLADALPAGIAIRCCDGDAYDGSREDDSGTLSESEPSEEDDREEQEGRQIHLFAAAPPRCGLDGPIHVASLSTPGFSAKPRSCAVHVRGPPATR